MIKLTTPKASAELNDAKVYSGNRLQSGKSVMIREIAFGLFLQI